jgi:hypothetical protein
MSAFVKRGSSRPPAVVFVVAGLLICWAALILVVGPTVHEKPKLACDCGTICVGKFHCGLKSCPHGSH